jgi:hypothetical protein
MAGIFRIDMAGILTDLTCWILDLAQPPPCGTCACHGRLGIEEAELGKKNLENRSLPNIATCRYMPCCQQCATREVDLCIISNLLLFEMFWPYDDDFERTCRW